MRLFLRLRLREILPHNIQTLNYVVGELACDWKLNHKQSSLLYTWCILRDGLMVWSNATMHINVVRHICSQM